MRRKRFTSVFFASALVLAALALCACDSGGGGGSGHQERIINPTSIVNANAITLFASETDISVASPEAAVAVSFEPIGAKVAVWTDTDAILFDGNPVQVGDAWVVKFKPIRPGTFLINAQSGDVKKSLELKVTARASKIEITGYTSALDKGATVKLSAKTTPSPTTSNIVWKSSDKSVATVDQNGLVTAKGAGVATITATASDSSALGAGIPVTGYVEVSVKGFYLNDKFFVLCAKDVDDDVEARLVGIEDGNVAWQSSDANLFTVENVSTDTKSAKLKYVAGKEGVGKVTATLTTTSGTYTAEAAVIVAQYTMLALGDSIAAGYAPKPMGGKGHDEDMAEQDMIEAYEKYLNRRKGGEDPNYVNEFCYSYLLSERLKSGGKNMRLRGYANTGDQTKDLIEKLKSDYSDGTIATRKGEILEAVREADYITLCIGANDILQRATGMNILLKDLDWFRETFTQDLADFKTRFDSIIATLSDSPVSPDIYVMSVYSPYHYFKAGQIPDAQFGPPYGDLTKKIVSINNLAEDFITQLNNYISQKAIEKSNVNYVDVANVIDMVFPYAHKTYIHADPSKYDFEALVSTFGQTVPIWFDPHPTKAGAAKIKDIFAQQDYPN